MGLVGVVVMSIAPKYSPIQCDDKVLNRVQDQIARVVNPLVTAPMLQLSVLPSLTLVAGLNTINHGLGRPVQGWAVLRARGAIMCYDKQDTNRTPEKTLLLVASAPITIDLGVY